MYLHLGNKRTVRKKDVLGIFDADTSTVSAITKKFLSDADKRLMVESAGEEIPKSFVLYTENGLYKVCFSQFSPASLVGRMNTNMEFIFND